MAIIELDHEMEMPTPCEHCKNWFDLSTGFESKKWYPGFIICPDCYKEEKFDIYIDEVSLIKD